MVKLAIKFQISFKMAKQKFNIGSAWGCKGRNVLGETSIGSAWGCDGRLNVVGGNRHRLRMM